MPRNRCRGPRTAAPNQVALACSVPSNATTQPSHAHAHAALPVNALRRRLAWNGPADADPAQYRRRPCPGRGGLAGWAVAPQPGTPDPPLAHRHAPGRHDGAGRCGRRCADRLGRARPGRVGRKPAPRVPGAHEAGAHAVADRPAHAGQSAPTADGAGTFAAFRPPVHRPQRRATGRCHRTQCGQRHRAQCANHRHAVARLCGTHRNEQRRARTGRALCPQAHRLPATRHGARTGRAAQPGRRANPGTRGQRTPVLRARQ
jgi:hypothetical protein